MHRLSTLTALAALVWGAPAVHAQHSNHDWLDRCREDAQNADRPRYCEERTMGSHAGGGTITVDGGQNGGARVAGWDKDSIDVVARIQTNARSEDDARALAGQISISVSNGTIRASGPQSRGGASWSVSFDVLVPHASDLDITAYNGPVAVRSVHGKMELQAENGPLDIDDAGGDVHGRTTNGPLAVHLTGKSWDGRGLDAETTNGPVTMQIPSSYSAHLETGTSNGPMRISFPITVEGRLSRHITADLGSGGPTVRAVTTNGPLVLMRDE
ncbi:MAG TPA: DUF4097 family beta strand repeat-containing protein [Gemmatimonadaceae bacterium]|nr:DUF4097 family beta strand repeat-containing protein [Gemmatimonadaceae bacterium]